MYAMDAREFSYLFDGFTQGDLSSGEMANTVSALLETQNLYTAATRVLNSRLETLNDEFKYTKDRNPIHQILTRIKSPASILRKLTRKGLEVSLESAQKNLTDIAGVRVICSYIHDIYLIEQWLINQPDLTLLRKRDYILNPKENGYRSLHIIFTVPVFLSSGLVRVPAEVQIRTIAMDYWASLEHELTYKFSERKTQPVSEELLKIAADLNKTDLRMQSIYKQISSL
jgi:putative GTP pyrophosphokinase